jgi:ActR/RegA family two-component response regulator
MSRSGRISTAADGPSSVLVADPSPTDLKLLGRGFVERGLETWAATDVTMARSVLSGRQPDLVTSEMRFSDGNWLQILEAWRPPGPHGRLAVVTAQASVAGTIQALRAGAHHVYAKPVTADQILGSLFDGLPEDDGAPKDLTLDQALWEYMNRAVALRGSIAAAARSLGVDRRSLRRMLAKYSPRP